MGEVFKVSITEVGQRMLTRINIPIGCRPGLFAFLPYVSIYINEPVENYQVGQSGYNDETEVGLPSDCSQHYEEKSYIT